MKMKELEAETGIGRETIRYYIREGLLPEPERPKRNVASYGPEHVARLKLIRRLQQERHLPLSIIKSIVMSETAAPARGFEALIGLEVAMGPLLNDGRNLAPKMLADVARDTGLTSDEIRQFAAIGMINIDRRDGAEWLNQRNVRLMEIIAQTRVDGYTPEIGYTVDSYGIYPQMIELLARRCRLLRPARRQARPAGGGEARRQRHPYVKRNGAADADREDRARGREDQRQRRPADGRRRRVRFFRPPQGEGGKALNPPAPACRPCASRPSIPRRA